MSRCSCTHSHPVLEERPHLTSLCWTGLHPQLESRVTQSPGTSSTNRQGGGLVSQAASGRVEAPLLFSEPRLTEKGLGAGLNPSDSEGPHHSTLATGLTPLPQYSPDHWLFPGHTMASWSPFMPPVPLGGPLNSLETSSKVASWTNLTLSSGFPKPRSWGPGSALQSPHPET